MATISTFEELYTGGCEHCGADLEWEWIEDELYFSSTCTCGTDYILRPNSGTLSSEAGDLLDEEEIGDE